MEQVFTTVSSKGQMVIPAAMRESLGIEPGTRVSVRLDGDKLILHPQTRAATQRLIDRLCGLTAGGSSMCDELIAERHAEDAKSSW
jgi:AbrB family looped-hinge helix DNA binding protein